MELRGGETRGGVRLDDIEAAKAGQGKESTAPVAFGE